MTSWLRLADLREISLFTSGGGATAALGIAGRFMSAAARVVAARGTGTEVCDQATMFGRRTSCFSLMSGGVTMVWV